MSCLEILWEKYKKIYYVKNIEIYSPFSAHISEALKELRYSLSNLDLQEFKKKLFSRKLNLTDKELKNKITVASKINLFIVRSLL